MIFHGFRVLGGSSRPFTPFLFSFVNVLLLSVCVCVFSCVCVVSFRLFLSCCLVLFGMCFGLLCGLCCGSLVFSAVLCVFLLVFCPFVSFLHFSAIQGRATAYPVGTASDGCGRARVAKGKKRCLETLCRKRQPCRDTWVMHHAASVKRYVK